MRQAWFLGVLAVVLVGCGGDDDTSIDFADGIVGSAGPLLYPDDGISNSLFSCEEVASLVRENVELGMSRRDVRSIVGKPRHIAPEGRDWRYGTNSLLGAGDTPLDFFVFPTLYFFPVANFQVSNLLTLGSEDDEAEPGEGLLGNTFLNDFSGDNTLCDGQDLPFIAAANDYTQVAGNVDFTDEIPLCFDAAVRIAASVEQGMSLSQVRALVGKPIEVAEDGTWWRYQFGAVNAPYVFFTLFTPSNTYSVTGYSSITTSC